MSACTSNQNYLAPCGQTGLHVHLPVRALANEFGAQPPLGLFGPLGFSTDGVICFRAPPFRGDQARACALATVDYAVFAVVGALPSSLGLSFLSMPTLLVVPEEEPFFASGRFIADARVWPQQVIWIQTSTPHLAA